MDTRTASLLAKTLTPAVTTWAEAQERRILSEGRPLRPTELDLARRIGVAAPERIRILHVDRVPTPDSPVLRAAARANRFSLANIDGMALRYGIYLRSGIDVDTADGRFTLAHEIGHTVQYERAGGIARFLQRFLTEVLSVGYLDAPLEAEADRMGLRALEAIDDGV